MPARGRVCEREQFADSKHVIRSYKHADTTFICPPTCISTSTWCHSHSYGGGGTAHLARKSARVLRQPGVVNVNSTILNPPSMAACIALGQASAVGVRSTAHARCCRKIARISSNLIVCCLRAAGMQASNNSNDRWDMAPIDWYLQSYWHVSVKNRVSLLQIAPLSNKYLGKKVQNMLVAVPGSAKLGVVSVARSPEGTWLASNSLNGPAKHVPGRQHAEFGWGLVSSITTAAVSRGLPILTKLRRGLCDVQIRSSLSVLNEVRRLARVSRSRSRSRIIYYNTSYRKVCTLPPSCPGCYADLFRAPPLHEVCLSPAAVCSSYICYVVALIACASSTFGNDCILSSFFSFILTSNKTLRCLKLNNKMSLSLSLSLSLRAFMRLCVYGGGLFSVTSFRLIAIAVSVVN